MRFLEFKSSAITLSSLRSKLNGLIVRSYFLSLLCVNCILKYQRFRFQTTIVQFHFYGNIRRLMRYIFLCDIDTGRSTIHNCYVTLFRNDQPHGAIHASIYSKKTVIDRDNIRAGRIISFYKNLVIFTIF